MPNIRISNLSPLAAADVADNDLFPILDVSEITTKRITVGNVRSYLQLNISASATASWALNSKSASYLIYTGIPNGTASNARTASFNLSSSHALRADTASYALFSISSSYAKTSSYAVSCSWAATSSVQLIYSSAFADYANSASHLIYNGTPNGTAFRSISASVSLSSSVTNFLSYNGTPNGTASYALYAAVAKTSSYLLYQGYPNGTSSYALRSNLSILADGAKTSSFLQYSELLSNGTSSFAITSSNALTASLAITSSHALIAGSVNNVYKMYGPFDMTVSGAGLNTGSVSFSITSSSGGRRSYFEFDGEVSIPLTSSTGGHLDINFNNSADAQAFGNQSVLSARCQNTATGSLNIPFMYRMTGTNAMLLNNTKWDVTVKAYGSSSFTSVTPGTQNLRLWVFSTADTINEA